MIPDPNKLQEIRERGDPGPTLAGLHLPGEDAVHGPRVETLLVHIDCYIA